MSDVKLTMNPTTKTPSQEILAKAAETFDVTDANGRRITLKKPGVLDQYRLVDMLGDSAKNEVYMAMVLPLLYIVAIDGVPEGRFVSRIALDGLIQRLDEAGANAVMIGVQKHFGMTSEPEADKSSLKG